MFQLKKTWEKSLKTPSFRMGFVLFRKKSTVFVQVFCFELPILTLIPKRIPKGDSRVGNIY